MTSLVKTFHMFAHRELWVYKCVWLWNYSCKYEPALDCNSGGSNSIAHSGTTSSFHSTWHKSKVSISHHLGYDARQGSRINLCGCEEGPHWFTILFSKNAEHRQKTTAETDGWQAMSHVTDIPLLFKLAYYCIYCLKPIWRHFRMKYRKLFV